MNGIAWKRIKPLRTSRVPWLKIKAKAKGKKRLVTSFESSTEAEHTVWIDFQTRESQHMFLGLYNPWKLDPELEDILWFCCILVLGYSHFWLFKGCLGFFLRFLDWGP